MAYSTYRSIETLNRNNYDTWSLQAQAVLIKTELWNYVSGETKLSSTSSAEEKCKFEKLDIQARSELILLISPTELKQIKGCKTSKEIWDKLKSIHQSTGPARKATLLKQLVLKKMSSEEDIRDHLNNFMDVVGKLEDMDVKIHPELLSIMMLYSLPANYENFRIAIESRDVLPGPEELQIKIIEENEARKQTEPNDNSTRSEAFYARQKRKVIICKHCNKKGHTTEACWSKKGTTHPQKNKSHEKNYNVCYSSANSIGENLWCLDSGCSSHMTGEEEKFEVLTPEVNTLSLASKNHTLQIKGRGKISISTNDEKYNLNDALYVPEIATNLISVGKITDNGYKVLFEKEKASIIQEDEIIQQASRNKNGLYYLDFKPKESANFTTKSQDKSMLWHRKLGHINEKDLKMMVAKQMMRGLDIKEVKLDTCETCIKGKLSSLPFASHDRLSSEILEIIHSDVCGPFETESLAGSRYYVSFIDDFTRYCCIYFIKNKSQVIEKFKEYKNGVELFTNKKIKHLQSDNGGEYRSREFDDLLAKCGIKRRLTAPYTPQQNGVSERKNRSLLDKARCLMMEANVPSCLWAEAISTANYLINRSPAKALNGSTPYEKWVGRNPAGNHLHIFGSKAFILNKRRRGKFTPKATEGVFMGYAKNAKGFRVYLPDQNDVVISRDVKFIEKMYYDGTRIESVLDNSTRGFEKEKETVIQLNNKKNDQNSELPIQDLGTADQDQTSSEEDEEAESDGYQTPHETNERTLQRPIRTKKKPTWSKDYYFQDDMEEESLLVSDLSYLSEQNETEDDWHDAIKAEIRAHIKNETWKITKKTTGMKLIDYKLVLKTKTGPDNTETKKARLVARGFTQRPGIDYNETFAPVAKLSSIRTVVGMSVEEGMKLKQMDVTTAYLNGYIKEDITMKVPENLEKYVIEIIIDESGNNDLTVYNKAKDMLKCIRDIKGEKVCKLQRSLYGLKQSGRQWYIRLDTELRNIGFVPSQADPCVYVLQKGGAKVITAIWVDDLLIAYNCSKKMQEIQTMLAHKFEIKDLGIPQRMLGIDFKYTKDTVKLCQEKYIKDTLIKFRMEECKATNTPIEPGLSLEADKSPKDKELPYKNMIGTLMYLAVATRPDIMFAVSYLSQFNDSYNAEHFKSAKRVLRYLKGTSSIGLSFKRTEQELYGMADADWGACKLDRRSFSGYCFIYAGGCISWSSRKQKSVALSTAEAEYCACTEAAKEAIHLKLLLNDLGTNIDNVQILNDNQAALKLSQNSIVSSKSKHIDLKMHYIRNCIQNKQIRLEYLETKKMAADLLTKGLPGPRLKELIIHFGLA